MNKALVCGLVACGLVGLCGCGTTTQFGGATDSPIPEGTYSGGITRTYDARVAGYGSWTEQSSDYLIEMFNSDGLPFIDGRPVRVGSTKTADYGIGTERYTVTGISVNGTSLQISYSVVVEYRADGQTASMQGVCNELYIFDGSLDYYAEASLAGELNGATTIFEIHVYGVLE